jgi:hypothetical protein
LTLIPNPKHLLISYTGSKRTREDNSGISLPKGGKRVTRSTSQAQHAEAGNPEVNETQRNDTAASPAQPGHAISAPLLLPPRPRQDQAILNKLSTIASKHLDAQAQARFFHEVQMDDELAEVAYQRGLLVNFVITPPSTASGSSPPFQVEAPEFATVEYLKRRITKAKLLLSEELFVYDRFALRQAHFPGRESTGELKILDEKMPSTNIPMLLFNLGYRGGETHNVTMISRSGTNDKAQQDNMIREAVTANAQRLVPLADPAARAYQALLAGVPVDLPPVITSVPEARHGANGAIAAAPAVYQAPAPLPPPEALAMNNNALQLRSPGNQRIGRWSATEIEALVGGVEAKMSWGEIRRAFPNEIDPRRTPVDLKDKWRNLVKVCLDPNKTTRSVGISGELQLTIARLHVGLNE